MKNLFKPDTQGALDKTRRELADVEANITALLAARTEKLAQTDEIAEIQAVDKAVEAERAAAEIYRDKAVVAGRIRPRSVHERRVDQRLSCLRKMRREGLRQISLARG